MKKQQIQQQQKITAYEKKVTHDLFLMTIEWLEKYIEVAYKKEFPDWKSRKQIHDDNIKRTDIDGNTAMAEDTLSTQLLLFESNLKRRPEFIREELKQEFYRWINAFGINTNNCPERLAQFLFGIHEILEGHGEKIRKDVENEKRLVEPNSPEYMEQMKNLFVYTQVASQKEEGIEKSLEGKTHKDIEIESRFGSGNTEQGEEAFKRITGDVSASHSSGFHFFPQKGQSNNPQQRSNSEIIQDVKSNPQNWRIDEIIASYEFGKAKEESLLLHRTAEIDYDVMGNLKFDSQPIYRAGRFSSMEIAEIKEILLNISQSSSSTSIQQFLSHSKFDLTKVETNADKSNKDNNNKIGTIATISVFTSLVIGGVILVARNKLKKSKN